MDKNILIIANDNICLLRDQIDYPNFEIVRFSFTIDDKDYLGSEEYDGKWINEKYKNENTIAKTSSIVQGTLINVIEKYKDKVDLIVHVTMSSIMSAATFSIAQNVKEMYKDTCPIINIDSRQVMAGGGVVLLGIIDIIKETNNANDIVKLSDELIKNSSAYFIMGDLMYLHRGGRIGKAKALMGSILRIVPVLGLIGGDEDGQLLPVGKGRTFKQANSKIISLIKANMVGKSTSVIKRIVLAGVDDNREAFEDLEEKLKAFPCDHFIIGSTDLSGAIHTGPKSYNVGITF